MVGWDGMGSGGGWGAGRLVGWWVGGGTQTHWEEAWWNVLAGGKYDLWLGLDLVYV